MSSHIGNASINNVIAAYGILFYHFKTKAVLQSSAMEYGLGADFAISSSEYAKEQIYEKYLNNFLVEKQKEDANFAQQLRMPVHKFRKLLMNFSQQLYNKSYGIKELKAENLGTFEEWSFFNDLFLKDIVLKYMMKHFRTS